ncbi:MAG: histidine kinase, partial [Ignavibacteriales bacterium]|nr:histidine kinase [Ignavibacteriales bacterium]
YNIFLVVKESLNNIVKHSGATEVWIRIAADNILFTIDIEDNGKGFSLETATPERHGLENMQKRISDVGGTLRQVSIPAKGTTISVTVALERK